jgi:hypothetical protein
MGFFNQTRFLPIILHCNEKLDLPAPATTKGAMFKGSILTLRPYRLPLPRRLLTLIALLFASPAQAAVTIYFHSFNGSVVWGRYPHALVVFDGTLDATGQRIHENFGFSTTSSMAALTQHPAPHVMLREDDAQIGRTNRHFGAVLTDAQYHLLREEVDRWEHYPTPYYDLDRRNCVHFVARLAQMAGLTADVPERFVRRPKAWLNYVTRMNPRLGAQEID